MFCFDDFLVNRPFFSSRSNTFDVEMSIMNRVFNNHFMTFHFKFETVRTVSSFSSSFSLVDFLNTFVRLVTESFRDFCKSEILTGDNLYDAGSVHGLQVNL